MNFTTAVFLLNDSCRAIRVSYDTDLRSQSSFNYVFKSFDETIKKDDIVVVPTDTRHGFTCVKVEEVDVDVNFDSPQDYRWIVAKVSMEFYETLKKQEGEAITKVRQADLKKRKKELAASLLGDQAENLKMLDLAKSPGVTATAIKTE